MRRSARRGLVFLLVALPALLAVAAPVASGDPVPLSGARAGRLVFRDEFDGSSLHAARWGTCFAWGSCLNAGDKGDFTNAQCYTPGNVRVRKGELRLTARVQPATCDGRSQGFTSGMVQARRSAARLYGYFEARIRVPSGDDHAVGLWPAFWLAPRDLAPLPEIDVLEVFGGRRTGPTAAMLRGPDGYLHPQRISATLHRRDGSRVTARNYGPRGPGSTAWDKAYHVWGVDWRPGSLGVYVDRTLMLSTRRGVPSVPMYPIINLALRQTYASWLARELPQTMDVDYVRIWR